jgi:hypothetical protein
VHGEVLAASKWLLSGVAKRGEHIAFDPSRGIARQASMQAHDAVEAVPSMVLESRARVSRRDPDLHHRATRDDVEHVPDASLALVARAFTRCDMRRRGTALMSFLAKHTVRLVGP